MPTAWPPVVGVVSRPGWRHGAGLSALRRHAGGPGWGLNWQVPVRLCAAGCAETLCIATDGGTQGDAGIRCASVDLASFFIAAGGGGGIGVGVGLAKIYRAKSEKRAVDATRDESLGASAQAVAAAAAQAAALIRTELERVEAGRKADRVRIEDLERLLRLAHAALAARGIVVPDEDDPDAIGDG